MSVEDVEKALTKRGFGETQDMAERQDTAATAVAAQAQAAVQARYIYAERHPRRWSQVRQDLTEECKRPEFANNKSAIYRKPIGQSGVEGLGIRFVEVALRCMGNVLIESPTIYEDEKVRIVRVSVTDLEANLTHFKDVVVSKTVERKFADPEVIISTRKNTKGDFVHTVPATDDELLNKEAALISKALRTQGLRLIPGDLQDDAERIIREVRKNKAAQDPKAEAKAIADAFAELHVKAKDLEELLDHPLDQCNPNELVELRGYYGALADGETTWKAIILNKKNQEAPVGKTRGVEAVEETVTKVKEEPPAKKTEPVAEPPAKTKPKPPTDSAPPFMETPEKPKKAEPKPEPPPKKAEPKAEPKPAPKVEESKPEPKPAAKNGGKRLVLRKVEMPEVLTRSAGDPEVSEDVMTACREEAARLGQDLKKLTRGWTGVEIEDLNEESVVCLTQALKNVPTKSDK